MVCGPSWNDLWKEVELVTSLYSNQDIVSLTELKKHCRLPFDDTSFTEDDDLLRRYSHSAEKLVEDQAEITLTPKVKNLNLARWPGYSDYLNIRLEFPPVVSIVHVKYYDTDDVQQTLDSDLYEVWTSRNPPSLLVRAENVPSISSVRSKVIEIQVNAGFSLAVPHTAALAIMELTSFWYQNRESYGRIPMAADGAQGRVFSDLVNSLRWRVYP